eukprot:g5932.t1
MDSDFEFTVQNERRLQIAHGSPASPSRFPYAAMIAFQDNLYNQVHVCGGTMIHPHWLITAASCLGRSDRLFISVGDTRVHPMDLIRQEEADLVQAHFVYDLFHGNLAEGNDLGLLYLRTPQGTIFPSLPVNESSLDIGENLVGLGRGITDINSYFSEYLQVASGLQYENLDTCRNQTNGNPSNIEDNIICVTGPTQRQTICRGDEGGALLQVDPDSYAEENSHQLVEGGGDPENDVLYGIASFGPEDCGSNGPSFYTNIFSYLQWINNTMTNYSPPPPTVNNNAYSEQEVPEEDNNRNTLLLGLLLTGGIVLVLVIAALVYRWSRYSPSGCLNSNRAVANVVPSRERSENKPNHNSVIKVSPFLASYSRDSTAPSSSDNHMLIETLNTNINVELTGKKIGSGAFGHVQEGIYTDNEGISHLVAVKSVKLEVEDSRSALLNEMQIFERVGRHPNIVQCFGGKLDSSSDDPTGYYLIEELMVCDLGSFFRTPGLRQKLTFREFLQIFYGIVNGLQHLHNCDVIHFDLKPSNILLDENNNPKLADFGCSRKRAHSYITAGARGTMAYMAPELWLLGIYAKKAQVRAEKLDVFSYGVVMWETLTNRTPLDPLNFQELLSTVTSQDLESSSAPETSGTDISEDFRTHRFPLMNETCPAELRELMWNCLNYFNELRPNLIEIKTRIEQMFHADWVDQNINEVCVLPSN